VLANPGQGRAPTTDDVRYRAAVGNNPDHPYNKARKEL
jgi:hypothetical protein